MPRHKSAKKRVRTSREARLRRRAVTSRVKSAMKEFRGARENKAELLPQVTSLIDKAASKGVFHRNKAARLKSRLARLAAKATVKH